MSCTYFDWYECCSVEQQVTTMALYIVVTICKSPTKFELDHFRTSFCKIRICQFRLSDFDVTLKSEATETSIQKKKKKKKR